MNLKPLEGWVPFRNLSKPLLSLKNIGLETCKNMSHLDVPLTLRAIRLWVMVPQFSFWSPIWLLLSPLMMLSHTDDKILWKTSLMCRQSHSQMQNCLSRALICSHLSLFQSTLEHSPRPRLTQGWYKINRSAFDSPVLLQPGLFQKGPKISPAAPLCQFRLC